MQSRSSSGVSSSIGRVLEAACALLLGVLALNGVIELFAWTLWQRSFAALEEIQGILVVWFGLLAAAYCLAEGLHLAVDVVARRFPARWQPVLGRLPGVACAGFGILLAVFGVRLVLAIDNTLPGTGWSASLLYQPAVAAGALIGWLGGQQAFSGSKIS
ncbi:MAG: TRAP transporter small permease [Thermoanaerobaculia bacterium]